MDSAEFIVVGAGSAGCAVAAGLAARGATDIRLVEAGPTDLSPLVRMPFGLSWMMGSKKRDWRFTSVPQSALGGRKISIPRGKMLGGSSSINSMVWFRGLDSDFDGWNVQGWRADDVRPAFDEIEARTKPTQLNDVHPLSQRLSSMFASNSNEAPRPDLESAGIFRFNLIKGRRNSAMDAFLRPRPKAVAVVTNKLVDRVCFDRDRAIGVRFADGQEMRASKGVILSAGSIASPAILMRSGIGPANQLARLGIDVVCDSAQVGQNLHDHPAVGLHHAGAGSGYGLTLTQAFGWALAPFRYAILRTGRFASPTVEGGGFFKTTPEQSLPDVQMHFIPFMLGWNKSRFTFGSGYFADVCVCRPKSRGTLTLRSRDPHEQPEIDFGLLSDKQDADTLVQGIKKLRTLLDHTKFGRYRADEQYPGRDIAQDDQILTHVYAHAATAYHPVGTLRMGQKDAPVTSRLAVRGARALWVADASVMPNVTSANTNAPSMMIGHRAAQFIYEDAA